MTFISEQDFRDHVRETIASYGEKLEPYDVAKFNSNLIDPIKMVFDKAVYGFSWKDMIDSEVFRQRDKSNNNEIGYFHQGLFKYIEGCHVPQNGHDGGWDVIVSSSDGFLLEGGNTVHRLYIEMKNKHNTMNSSASQRTYIKMQDQLLNDDDCACFLVEAIAKHSQNITWCTSLTENGNKRKVQHTRIRRVSIDKFYELVTGEENAFMKVCNVLPAVVESVLSEQKNGLSTPHDTVYEELEEKAATFHDKTEDMAMILSMYMLGFNTYNGFRSLNISW